MLTLPYVTSATSESNFDVLIWGLESNILLSNSQKRDGKYLGKEGRGGPERRFNIFFTGAGPEKHLKDPGN